MKIKFLRNERGTLTHEALYLAGQEADLDPLFAQQLVDEGIAVSLEPPVEPEVVEEVAEPKRRSRREVINDSW